MTVVQVLESAPALLTLQQMSVYCKLFTASCFNEILV